MTVRLFVRTSQQALARNAFASGLIPRTADMAPALREAVAIRRKSVAAEFQSESHFLPSGGTQRWRKTKPFFTTPAPAKTLQRSGALARAYQGGPGGFERIGPTSATFGVSGSRFPHASVHRQGAKIRITGAMRGYMLATHGKTFRARKRTIRIPPRPHGGPTPETRRLISQAFLRYLATGRASGRAA
jgi:hypothetical protein